MIVAGRPKHETLVTHDTRRRPIWFCYELNWFLSEFNNAVDLTDHYEIHYRRGCPGCFIGFMHNARTKNLFSVDGVRKAAYDLEEARLWFFGLYKGETDEGE